MICLLNHPSSFSNGNFGCLEYSDQSHALVSTWDLNRHVSKEWVVRRSLLLVRFACVTFNMQPPGWAVIEHYIHTFKRSARYPSKSAQLCKRRCFVSVWAALMVCRFPASVKNVKASKVNSLFPPFLRSPPPPMSVLCLWASLLVPGPPACINWGWLDLSCDCGELPGTRCRFLVDWLFKAPLTFPEIEERAKGRKGERSEQITREAKGAAIFRFLVSTWVLLSHLVKSAGASLYFLPLKNLSLSDKCFAN